jgi:hypothetical protein
MKEGSIIRRDSRESRDKVCIGTGTTYLGEQLVEVSHTAVLEQLERLLGSNQLRNSKRHQRLLTYLISASLRGESADIKERVIGAEVFGRPADYDVSIDPIVRGAIADLRKRLALYYAEAAHSDEVHVEVPLGAYVPRFFRPSFVTPGPDATGYAAAESGAILAAAPASFESTHEVVELKPSRFRNALRWILWTLAAPLLTAAMFAAYYYSPSQRQERAFKAFWAPLTGAPGNILLCVGSLDHIMQQPAVPNDTWMHVTLTRNHLDPNAAAAASNVASVLGAMGKRSDFRVAGTTTLADLRSQRAVYIGGASNPWAMRLQANLRFQIVHVESASLIVDFKEPRHTIASFDASERVGSISHDFGLITRTTDPLTGYPVIALAGLGSYGTFTASEFASEPQAIATAISRLSAGWEHRTVQIVATADVVDGKASPPRIVTMDIR